MIIVIVVVLIIAIPTILAGVLYIMVSGLIGVPGPNPGTQKPFVTFSSANKIDAVTWQFAVAGASPPVSPSNYKMNFAVAGTMGTAVNLGPSGVNATVYLPGASPSSVEIKWTDIGGEGTVNAGDLFTVGFPAAPTAGTALTFYLLYSDGSQIQSQSWQG